VGHFPGGAATVGAHAWLENAHRGNVNVLSAVTFAALSQKLDMVRALVD